MNVARLNFSHGSHEEHSEVLALVREESSKAGIYTSCFQDLCGPKIRIGEIAGGETVLAEGSQVTLRHYDGTKGNSETIFVEAFNPAQTLRTGERALLADGNIELLAKEVTKDEVHCSVISGGKLRSRSGIAVPQSRLKLPCLTQKDHQDVAWAVKNQVDYIALSFVSSEKDVLELKSVIRKLGGEAIPIIAKIERASSMDRISEIVSTAEAVMIARGDLGLELPLELVPGAQRMIIEAASFRGTPVITATQMLQSMVTASRPTRAEVTDVCTAVRDGTDAVMLSEETAIGNDPVHVVEVLGRILEEADKDYDSGAQRLRFKSPDQETVSDAICYAACGAATKVTASAIVACTESGYTARLMSKYRPTQPLFGATTKKHILNRMALYWGVCPVAINLVEEAVTEDEITRAMTAARDQYGLKPGARVVVTAGLRSGKSGSTMLMEIREIPR